MTLCLWHSCRSATFTLAMLITALSSGFGAPLRADTVPDAGMLRYPDVSATHIVFSYANDLWIVPRAGGLASPLAGPAGTERFPRFSPDGTKIAFSGNYEGGTDLYVCPVGGGIAERVTYHPAGESLCDWMPDGGLLYSSNGWAGLSRMVQLFQISEDVPVPRALPVPYGTNGAVSADGEWLAYTPYSRDTRTWKRYRGGMASDIWLYNLKSGESKQITDWEGTDSLPMWNGTDVYYLSDAGKEHRLNIWKYDTKTGKRAQVTAYPDYDVKWPSVGPGSNGNGEIVYQYGSSLHLLDLKSEQSTVVKVTIPGDRPRLRRQVTDASKNITGASISPSGKRVAVAARGDIWTAPASKGTPRNLTATSGAAERYPAWSPDGRWIAYFSDATGEYELVIRQSDGRGETRQLTHDGHHWRYNPVWSPDSEWIAFTDKKGGLLLHSVESGETRLVATDPWGNQPSVSWSADSQWITYPLAKDDRSGNQAIWIYNVQEGKSQQLTSGYFNDSDPVFDRAGDFLYYHSNRRFTNPQYEEVGTTFVYRDTAVMLAMPLRRDVVNPLLPEIDEVSWDEETDDAESDDANDEESEDGEADEEDSEAASGAGDPLSGTWSMSIESDVLPPEARSLTLQLELSDDGRVSGSIVAGDNSIGLQNASWDTASSTLRAEVQSPLGEAVIEGQVGDNSMSGTVSIAAAGITADFSATREAAAGLSKSEDSSGEDGDGDDEPAQEAESLVIEVEGAERRVIPLPIEPGRFSNLTVNSKNQLIYARASSDGKSSVSLFDLKAREPKEQEIFSGRAAFELSADGKKLLVFRGGSVSITDAAAGKGSGKPVSTSGMQVLVDPREEWEQIYHDAWRMERDFFYDPTLHGVDWDAVRDRYAGLLDDAASRSDVGFIIGEMISELNVGHAYYRGVSDDPNVPSSDVGLLGCRLEAAEGGIRIAEIWQGAAWDTDARNPLADAGVRVGQFLLDVEGRPLTADSNPYAAFQGLAGRLVTLTVSDDAEAGDDDQRVVVKLLRGDTGLRFRHWIEGNRARVDELSEGRIGYIYVTNTGQPGQNDLFRQFYAQMGKEALIIDDRWNGGGQIPTRFIELLNRPATNMWARRDGRDWLWPPDSHQGPKCMLINGLAGSGGDMFPALFRQTGLGKLIGRRTWGGLVGITGGPSLVDGASVSVPSFAYYEMDGTWGIEGHGVDPDIEVIDDPAKMQDGGDPQLETAVDHLKKELKRNSFKPPVRPEYPNRSGMGIPKADR